MNAIKESYVLMGLAKKRELRARRALSKNIKERQLLVATSAFGEIRKDLMNNIGIERTKGFLFRYGWGLGKRDALKVKDRSDMTLKEKILTGPLSHTKTGQVIAESTNLQLDEAELNTFVCMEGTWYKSYEAEQHVKKFGTSNVSVCHTLTGYASGYLSTLFNETIIVKETTCAAEGARLCRWIGKRASEWGEEAAEYVDFLTEKPIILELEETYEELLQRRNKLAKIAEVQKILTETIMDGRGFQSIAEQIAAIIHAPLIIENFSLETVAVSPILRSTYEEIKTSFQNHIQTYGSISKTEKNRFLRTLRKTKVIDLPYHVRVITPIYLQGNIYGYASLILPHKSKDISLAEAVVERVATFCSLYLLNEQVKYETLERMKGNLLEDLIEGIIESKNEIIQRGKYLQVDLDKPYYVSILRYDPFSENVKCEIEFHEKILDAITRINKKNKTNILIAQRTKYVELYIPVEESEEKSIEAYIVQLVQQLKRNFPFARFQAGISERGTDVHKVKELHQQAKIAVRLGERNEEIIPFSDVGMIGALVAENDEATIVKNAERLLAPLFQKGKPVCEETLQSLYTYLKNARNLEQTAHDLSLSVSGVRYRVRKIEKELGRKLTDPLVNYELLLALQSLQIIGKVNLFY